VLSNSSNAAKRDTRLPKHSEQVHHAHSLKSVTLQLPERSRQSANVRTTFTREELDDPAPANKTSPRQEPLSACTMHMFYGRRSRSQAQQACLLCAGTGGLERPGSDRGAAAPDHKEEAILQAWAGACGGARGGVASAPGVPAASSSARPMCAPPHTLTAWERDSILSKLGQWRAHSIHRSQLMQWRSVPASQPPCTAFPGAALPACGVVLCQPVSQYYCSFAEPGMHPERAQSACPAAQPPGLKAPHERTVLVNDVHIPRRAFRASNNRQQEPACADVAKGTGGAICAEGHPRASLQLDFNGDEEEEDEIQFETEDLAAVGNPDQVRPPSQLHACVRAFLPEWCCMHGQQRNAHEFGACTACA
jgi:hypothetical protein